LIHVNVIFEPHSQTKYRGFNSRQLREEQDMKHKTGIAALIAGVLALTSLAASPQSRGQGGQQGGGQGAGQGQQMGGARPADRDRQQDRDRADVQDQDRDQDRDRDRLSAPLGDGDIYGH
jgi:hypothetical protein